MDLLGKLEELPTLRCKARTTRKRTGVQSGLCKSEFYEKWMVTDIKGTTEIGWGHFCRLSCRGLLSSKLLWPDGKTARVRFR